MSFGSAGESFPTFLYVMCYNIFQLMNIERLFQPFTTNFPRADIYELLTPDLLHQAIKGTYKDHLVTWVEAYLNLEYGTSRGAQILDEVDWRFVNSTQTPTITHCLPRISLVPPFPGLRRFKQGRNFQQWTGNDSKAFMKVFVTALEGFVPIKITKTIVAFLDFCYIARCDTLTKNLLDALDSALGRFHLHREIFRESGVRPTGFSLPRQHSLTHYRHHIEKFGAPNGLSSSITESKHIVAVKKPWRQSNRYEALGQMLSINTRNDKLTAARTDFSSRGMLNGTCLGEVLERLQNMSEDADHSDDEEMDGGLDCDCDEGWDLDADEDGDEDGTGPVDGSSTLSEVALARKPGKGNAPFTIYDYF